jgi:hypothetical protein
MGNEKAAEALKETRRAMTATTGGHTPDLEKATSKAE